MSITFPSAIARPSGIVANLPNALIRPNFEELYGFDNVEQGLGRPVLTVQQSGDDVLLTVGSVAGATSYTFKRDGVTLTTQAGLTYTDNSVVKGVTYNYTVEATDGVDTSVSATSSFFIATEFLTASLQNGTNLPSATNILTFTVQPDTALSASSSITLSGLTGSATADGSLTISGAGASIFGSAGSWTQSTGTLVLTVDTAQTLPTGSDTVVSFTLTNPVSSSGVTSVDLSSTNFTTASISGLFLEAVANKYNIPDSTDQQTEATIAALTPTNPSGEVTVKFGSDTGDLYVWDGSDWYIYDNNYAWTNNTYSLSFDGSDDYMSIPDADIFSLGNGSGTDNAFSISGWFNADSIDTFYIATKDASGAREWAFRTVSSQLHFFTFGTGGGYIGRKYSSNLSTGQWYHAVVTYDGSKASSGIKLYLNGSRVDDADYASGTFTASKNTTAEVRVGALQVNNTYTNGKLDEITIFNTELSASDVTAIYNSGVPTDLSSYSPVGWWRMGDNDRGIGNTVTDRGFDSQGNQSGNDGALKNISSPNGFVTDVPS